MKNNLHCCFRILFLVLLMLSGYVFAQERVQITQIWAQMVKGQNTAAVYLTLSSSEALMLIGAHTPITKKQVQLHQMQMTKKQIMRMRQIEQIVLKPNQPMIFKPNGFHIMLTDINLHLIQGQQFPLTMRFKDKNNQIFEKTVQVTIKKEAAN